MDTLIILTKIIWLLNAMIIGAVILGISIIAILTGLISIFVPSPGKGARDE